MSLEQAIEENTKTLQALIALIRETPIGKFVPDVATAQAQAVIAESKIPNKTIVHTAAGTNIDTQAITYDTLKTAFLALIRQLGSAEAAKAAVLTPLGLSDLKSNENKPDLFPAILEKITQAKAAV